MGPIERAPERFRQRLSVAYGGVGDRSEVSRLGSLWTSRSFDRGADDQTIFDLGATLVRSRIGLSIRDGQHWRLVVFAPYVHTGNPVYPYFRHVFGGRGLDDVLDPIKRPLAVTAWNLVSGSGQ